MPKITNIADAIIAGLATSDFEGINAEEFWNFVNDLEFGVLDDTYKPLVWKWLLELNEFQIMHVDRKKRGQLEEVDLKSIGSYQEFFSLADLKDYHIKVTDDYQSWYLVGVKKKDNKLGGKPYELIRYIAAAKEKGINSIDLIKKCGQDKRSLTTRLQVLEENQLIKKVATVTHKASTNHMTHFRFTDSITKENPKTDASAESHELMMQIVDMLKKSENKIRLTRDVYEELKPEYPDLKLRYFNSIAKCLVDNSFIEHIQVEHGELNRFYPALRLIKDLPPASKRTEFLRTIKQQNRDEDLSNDEEEYVSPTINRFFPLSTQIYNLVDKNPGITAASIDSQIFGSISLKKFSTVFDNLSTVVPDSSVPRGIVGKLHHTGKCKIYRFSTQETLNRRNGEYKPVEDKELGPPNKTSLFEQHILDGTAFPRERRFKIVSCKTSEGEDKYFIIAKGYSGKLGLSLTSCIPTRAFFRGHYETQNHWIKLDIPKNKLQKIIKDKEAYKAQHEARSKMVQEHNAIMDEIKTQILQDTVFDANNDIHMDESNEIFQNLATTQPEPDTTPLPEEPIIDYGPSFRKAKIMENVEKYRCICIDVEFGSRLAKEMKLDYKIDRRTLMKDCAKLVEQGLIKTQKYENGRFVAMSVKTPPSEEEIQKCIVYVGPKYSGRKFADKVKLEKLELFNKNSLVRGMKFPDKESRLESAMKRSENNSTRKPLARRARIIGINVNRDIIKSEAEEDKEITAEEEEIVGYDRSMADLEASTVTPEVDDEGNEIPKKSRRGRKPRRDADDLFVPLMDDRKRKKFNKNNKAQSRVASAFKKIRSSIKITNEHILLMIKAIVVTQSLSLSSNIDWPKVSNVLNNHYESETLRKQWPKYRKMLGPKNLMTARKNWENALFSAIEKGLVKVEHLDNYDAFRMIDLWQTQGADIFINKVSDEISDNYDENFNNRVFKPVREDMGNEMFRETFSMIEKQQLFTCRNFMYPVYETVEKSFNEEAENPSDMHIAKAKLKALFATEHGKFDSSKVRGLFASVPKELYAAALTELEDKRAIAFLGEDSRIKFTLTDKLILTLDCKLDDTFVSSAKKMMDILSEFENTKNAMLLSQKSPYGSFAPIFGLVARNELNVTRIDQRLDELNSYYTKSWDRSKYEADFLLSGYKESSDMVVKQIPPIIDSPCSYLWVNLSGDFNKKLWHKCVYVILWNIVFYPGTSPRLLHARIYPLLEPFEVKGILDWLVDRKNVKVGEFGGYWPTDCWFDVE